jgi:magnesium-transporting ATPase (P-type)
MASTGATGTHEAFDNPDHLNTKIESGNFDEKHDAVPAVAHKPEDEEEDEDMDALIDELESQDGHAEDDENEEQSTPGGGRVVPEDQLQTDTRVGLTEAEVHARRKKYGLNQMKEEKENLFLKFLGYFIGPIQFVMEVCYSNYPFFPFSIPASWSSAVLCPQSMFPSTVPRLLTIYVPQLQGGKGVKNPSERPVLTTMF